MTNDRGRQNIELRSRENKYYKYFSADSVSLRLINAPAWRHTGLGVHVRQQRKQLVVLCNGLDWNAGNCIFGSL